jgi:hypothetical protein
MRLAVESELMEHARLSIEYSRQLLRDTENVIAENARLRRKLTKLVRDLN